MRSTTRGRKERRSNCIPATPRALVCVSVSVQGKRELQISTRPWVAERSPLLRLFRVNGMRECELHGELVDDDHLFFYDCCMVDGMVGIETTLEVILIY